MPSKSATYWDSMDFESEDNSEFSSSPEQTLRNYVDPWDLENYAYIRKHLASTPEPSTPTFVGEPTDSTFYYIPGASDSRQSADTEYNLDSFLYPPETIYGNTNKFAGIDEAQFHNDRINANLMYSSGEYAATASIHNNNNNNNNKNNKNIEPTYLRRQQSVIQSQNEKIYEERRMHSTEYSDMETSSDCEDDSSPMVSDEPVVYVYETNKRRRSMAIPIPTKSMTFIKPRRHSMMAKTVSPKDYDRYGSQSSDYTPSRSVYGKITKSKNQPTYGYNLNDSDSRDLRDLPQPQSQPIYLDRSDIYNSSISTNKTYREDNIYGTYKIRKASTHKSIKEVLTPTMPIYDQTTILRRLKKPTNFGLSNYGHLKIDYSFNWNTLDRFIRT